MRGPHRIQSTLYCIISVVGCHVKLYSLAFFPGFADIHSLTDISGCPLLYFIDDECVPVVIRGGRMGPATSLVIHHTSTLESLGWTAAAHARTELR